MKPHTDSRRRTLLEEIEDAAQTVAKLTPAAMTLIHDSLNGHPRAARWDRNSSRTTILWCDLHGREHAICKAELFDCGGSPIDCIDPTGDAAMRPDEAAQAEREIDRDLVAARNILVALANRVTTWQPASSEMQHPDRNSPTAPYGHCVNCWRNDKELVLITRRKDGTPYYAGLCQWCGEFRAEHHVLPPLAILVLHHARPRRNITAAIIERHVPAARRTA